MASLLTALALVASVAAAVVPMVAFLALTWWLDRYDREPAWLVGLTFLWGATIATGLALLANTAAMTGIGAFVDADRVMPLTATFVAPLVEEPSKAAVLLLVALSRHFDDTADGFVYGATAGFGFGMTENLLYFAGAAPMVGAEPILGGLSWLGIVLARTFFSAVMHATATALVGAAVGLGRYRPWPLRLLLAAVGLVAALALHAGWNGLLSARALVDEAGDLSVFAFALLPVAVLVVFGLFQLALLGESRTIRRELAEEARAGTLPAEHVLPLSRYLDRLRGGFVSPGVDARAYVRAATTLAMRRAQLARAEGEAAVALARDAERLRRQVRSLLGR